MKLLFVLLLISTTALCQKVDTLKNLPPDEVKKLQEIRKQKDQLTLIESVIIESAFNHRGVPIPQKKEFDGKDILYIKDESKNDSAGKK